MPNSKAYNGLLTAVEYNNIFANLNKLKTAFYIYSDNTKHAGIFI